MSIASRCDRCKTFYDRNDKDDELKRIGYKGAKIHGMMITDQYENRLKYFDLCPECAKGLDNFMNHGEEYLKDVALALMRGEGEVKTDVEFIRSDLCKSCNTKGCIFQSGIVRSHCDFYKAESEE